MADSEVSWAEQSGVLSCEPDIEIAYCYQVLELGNGMDHKHGVAILTPCA